MLRNELGDGIVLDTGWFQLLCDDDNQVRNSGSGNSRFLVHLAGLPSKRFSKVRLLLKSKF